MQRSLGRLRDRRQGRRRLLDSLDGRGAFRRSGRRDGGAIGMANRRIDPRRIKTHFPYTGEEAADALGVHKNTVRMWIKCGLAVGDDRRPTVMSGAAIRAFLENRAGSVCLNSRLAVAKWISAMVMLQPGLAAAQRSRPHPASAGQGSNGAFWHCKSRRYIGRWRPVPPGHWRRPADTPPRI